MTAFLLIIAFLFGIPLLMTGIAAAFIYGNTWWIGVCWILFLPLTMIVYVAASSDIDMGGTQ
jgi:hypothetical protein